MPSRSLAGGLPSGPRSRSQGRRSHDREDDGYSRSSSSRHMRPQKSLANLQSESSSRAPPMPSSRPSARHVPSDSSSYRSSDGESVFSSASSFMDRIRAGTGYTSSRTSIDDDGYDNPPKQEPAGNGYGFGDASTIWNSVTSTASSLTVNVSKAWTANIPTLAGEETPAGAESRLTRAMKAYHREKAQSPADLPAFLFDESERRVKEPVREPRRRQDRYDSGYSRDDEDYEEAPRAAPSRGLRDIYAAATPSDPPARSSGDRPRRPFGNNNAAPSRGADRLKAMRDAKRGAGTGYDSSKDRFDEPSAPAAPPPRMGLPGNPGRRRY